MNKKLNSNKPCLRTKPDRKFYLAGNSKKKAWFLSNLHILEFVTSIRYGNLHQKCESLFFIEYDIHINTNVNVKLISTNLI